MPEAAVMVQPTTAHANRPALHSFPFHPYAEAYLTPEAAVMVQLYAALLNDYLSEVTYPAELAGLHYGVRPTVAGLLISVYGYSDTLATLAQTVLDRALGFEVAPDRFEVVKEKKAKDFANMK
jgi:insulysin